MISKFTQDNTNDYNRIVSIPASTNSGVTMSGTDSPVDMFRNAVITLTTKGNVEEYIRPIIDILKRGVNDMAVLNEIIEILYEHVSHFSDAFWFLNAHYRVPSGKLKGTINVALYPAEFYLLGRNWKLSTSSHFLFYILIIRITAYVIYTYKFLISFTCKWILHVCFSFLWIFNRT